MKHLLLSILFIIVLLNAFSQDTIVKITSDQLIVKIIEVTSSDIRYKKWSYLDGPTFVINRAEISKIKYANGETDIISNHSNKAAVLRDLRTNKTNNDVNTYNPPVFAWLEYYPTVPSRLKINGEVASVEDAKLILGESTFSRINKNIKGINASYATCFCAVPVIATGIILTNRFFPAAITCYTLGAVMIGVGLPWTFILPKINNAIVSSYNNISSYNHKETRLNFTIAPNGMGIALYF